MKANDAVAMNDAGIDGNRSGFASQKPMIVERMPFSVRVVRHEEELHKAVAIRQAAYARHVPEFAEKLKAPEANDRSDGCAVLLAESKMDGMPVGTMRIQTNRYKDLAIQQSVELPPSLQGKNLAEATRLGITEARVGRVVKLTLFKAFYQYCVEAGIDWMVIAARAPLDRQYEALLFEDLFPGQVIPMKHGNNIPHRVLAFNVAAAEARWSAAKHPLFDFVFRTHHPDLDLSAADFSPWLPAVHPASMPASTALAAIAVNA